MFARALFPTDFSECGDERAEMDRLYQAVISQPSVAAYAESQAALMAICRSAAEYRSHRIGLDYASACGASCCG